MYRKKKLQSKTILIIMTIICAIVIVFSVTKINLLNPVKSTISYVTIPMQKGITSVGDWFSHNVSTLSNLKNLETENKFLQERVLKLEEENKRIQLDKIELERLQQLYKLDKTYSNSPKIAARVIGKNPGNWYHIFLIDKGSKDGIKEEMNVLAGNGLVGHIIEVGDTYSKVLSIIDDDSNVSGMFLRTSDLCIVKGDLKLMRNGTIKVENINSSAKIVEGDEVITSNISDFYFQGILIGTVKEIQEEPNKLLKTAYLEPAVDFEHLQEVLVIKEVRNK